MIKVTKDNKVYKFEYLEHIVHYENLKSILTYGLLSHNEAYKRKLIKEDISMDDVQKRREGKKININSKSYNLHDLVSLYFNSRNPMLYKRKDIQNELIIILVNSDILTNYNKNDQFVFFSDGNAASSSTSYYSGIDNLTHLDLSLIQSGSWTDENSGTYLEKKRKMCSEVLVHPSISVNQIDCICCPNGKIFDFVEKLKKDPDLIKNISHIKFAIKVGYFFF